MKHTSNVSRPGRILDPGYCLTLRPMTYPRLYEMYKAAIKNTWTVEEVNFSTDVNDLQTKMTDAERHMVHRLVAFFATGDAIVSNNLVISLYKHINAPEARMFLSRQLFEEALHIEFYLTLLDTYIPDHKERFEAFAAIENIPSIKSKAEFCDKWINSMSSIDVLETKDDRRRFLLNLICFAACVEGLFFFGAFAYVYFLRARGLLHGLAEGTNWVFRDESSSHMEFAFEVIRIACEEEPDLLNAEIQKHVVDMIVEAVNCEAQFARDVLGGGVIGLSVDQIREYLEFCADQRLTRLGLQKHYGSRNPLTFMDLQDVQELTNFFERRVSAYQIGVTGEVSLDEDF